MQEQWSHKIFNISAHDFDGLALEIFRLQSRENPVYRAYLDAISKDPAKIRQVSDIPFLPISFFRSHTVLTGATKPELYFESSGTTNSNNSRHYIRDVDIYRQSFRKGFELVYGPVNNLCLIGLLPSYLERSQASLVYMMQDLVEQSGHPLSGFYLHDHKKLVKVLEELERAGQKTILVGVTFALLDFAEQYSIPLKHTVIVETGGMKGRRQEMVRPEIHAILKKSFSVDNIHSEYGMTELLSQAWSTGNGIFATAPWMKILLRDEEDPLQIKKPVSNTAQHGAINVIDLANIHSCSFIATDDAGKLYPDGHFEVLGRMDNSDLRGCSLMVI